MFVLGRRLVFAAALPFLTGCQICVPSLKKPCVEPCGPEYHVKAPPQKVIVQRETPEAPCAEQAPAPKKEAPAPQQQPANAPQQQPAMAPQQPAMAPRAAQMGLGPLIGGGLVAIPALQSNVAFTLSFDWIKIPIPIPRLRTVEVPPETRLSYVQMGGASAAVAAPVMPAAAGVAPQECIHPDQLAAAIQLIKQRQEGGGATNGSGPSPAAISKAEEELNKRAKQLDDIERKLEEATRKLEAKQKGVATPTDDASWRSRGDKE